jgi:SAM-dependent methyltransferase
VGRPAAGRLVTDTAATQASRACVTELNASTPDDDARQAYLTERAANVPDMTPGASSRISPDDPAYAGQRDYTRSLLMIYDQFVLGFFGPVVWRAPTGRIVDLYRQHIGRRHLDIGPGTGYFLERARPPADFELTLLDPNPTVLAYASRRLAAFTPRLIEADVLKPIDSEARFDSVALSHVLHCLPGPMAGKAAAIRNVAAVLEHDGVLFGATVLGSPELQTRISRLFLRLYNWRGAFDNLTDTAPGLRRILEESFEAVVIETSGAIAAFTARRPNR